MATSAQTNSHQDTQTAVQIQVLQDADAQHEKSLNDMDDIIKKNAEKISKLESKVSVIEGIGYGFGGVFAVLQILSFLINKKVNIKDKDELD